MSDPMLLTEHNVHSVPPALRFPIAAASVESIRRYVGTPRPLRTPSDRIFAVRRTGPPLPLPAALAALPNAETLAALDQVWVHVDYASYRQGFEALGGSVGSLFVDHVFNRKHAREYGYRYVRLVPVSPVVNTSGGRGLETFALATLLGSQRSGQTLARFPESQPIIPRSEVCYAGPFAVCKMLNRVPGNQDRLPGVQQVYAAMNLG